MAPRGLLLLTCFSFSHAAANVQLPLPAKASAHGNEKRRWTGEIKRKIMAAGRRPRIRAVAEERRDVEEQSVKAPERKVLPEQQATRRRASSAPASQRDDRRPRDGGAPPEVVVVRRKRKEGLRVHFDLPEEEETSAAPPVEPRFPTGVLGEPPETGGLAHSSPEMTVAFLMSIAAERTGGGVDSAARIDRGLVARRAKRMEACSRRLSYLRDYCPFEREEEEVADQEDEESAPETTTIPAAEPDHPEEVVVIRPVKTGLPFKSPESEAEFVKAIRSRYLLKDDSLFSYNHASKGIVSS